MSAARAHRRSVPPRDQKRWRTCATRGMATALERKLLDHPLVAHPWLWLSFALRLDEIADGIGRRAAGLH